MHSITFFEKLFWWKINKTVYLDLLLFASKTKKKISKNSKTFNFKTTKKHSNNKYNEFLILLRLPEKTNNPKKILLKICQKKKKQKPVSAPPPTNNQPTYQTSRQAKSQLSLKCLSPQNS